MTEDESRVRILGYHGAGGSIVVVIWDVGRWHYYFEDVRRLLGNKVRDEELVANWLTPGVLYVPGRNQLGFIDVDTGVCRKVEAPMSGHIRTKVNGSGAS